MDEFSEYDWWRPYGTSDEVWWDVNTPANIDPYDNRFYRDSVGLGNTPGTPDVSFVPVSDTSKGLTIKDVLDFLKSPAGKDISAAGLRAINRWLGGGSDSGKEATGYQGGVPLFQAVRQQYAVPGAMGGPNDANDDAVRYWLSQPGLTDGQVAQQMYNFGVTPDRMATIRGTNAADEAAKYRAAFGPNLMVPRRPGAGGITYFSPTTYIDNNVTPATASGFNRNWYGTPVAPVVPAPSSPAPAAPAPPPPQNDVELNPGPGPGAASGGLVAALSNRAKRGAGSRSNFAAGGAVKPASDWRAPAGFRSGDTINIGEYTDLNGWNPDFLVPEAQLYAENPFMGKNLAELMLWMRNKNTYQDDLRMHPGLRKMLTQAMNAAMLQADPTFRNHYDEQNPNAALNGPGAGASANTQGVTWAPGVGQFDPAVQAANLAAAGLPPELLALPNANNNISVVASPEASVAATLPALAPSLPAAAPAPPPPDTGIAALPAAAPPPAAPAAPPPTDTDIASALPPASPAALPAASAPPPAAPVAPVMPRAKLTSAEYRKHAFPSRRLAAGGLASLPGGRLVRGPGDGTSDSVPAVIDGGKPARLGSGEFVFPARAVAEIGNGSTDAGAKKLYSLLNRIETKARSAKRGKPSGADKLLNRFA